MTTQVSRIQKSARNLYKYVFWSMGIWAIFVLTFAIAYLRVARSEKYDGLPFNPMTPEETHKPASSY